jgi:hypothetical protein
MPYIILIFGLVIIYFALRKEKKNNNSSIFQDILSTSLDKTETDYVMEKLSLMEMRIEEIENSLILLGQDLAENKIKSIKVIEEREMNQIVNLKEVETINEVNEDLYIVDNNISTQQDEDSHTNIENNTVIGENDTNKVIYELFDSGKSVDEIAEILRVGKGELLLRLGLRKQRK